MLVQAVFQLTPFSFCMLLKWFVNCAIAFSMSVCASLNKSSGFNLPLSVYFQRCQRRLFFVSTEKPLPLPKDDCSNDTIHFWTLTNFKSSSPIILALNVHNLTKY